MLILSMLFAPFRPPRTRFSPSAPYAPYAKIQVVGDAKLKRACMAAQDVDVAAVHSKTLPFFCSRPRGKTVAVRQVRASVLERVPTAWVGQVALGFLRLRSGQALRLRAPSAVSCDESVRRFAQDDDFVGALKKRIP
jgi:hypothetical protein